MLQVAINRENISATFLAPQTGDLYVINEIADRILSVCDGRPLTQIIEIIGAEYEGELADVIARDVKHFLRSAVRVGAVSWADE
jgi:hypothetical protein